MAPKEIRWGILATGGIARTFTKDLTVDPTTRGVTKVKHVVVAAASSSSKTRAEAFLKECNWPNAKAYGSYEEFVKDPNIDVIYIATPHSHHYQNAMLCLEAGKNVLCEKAFTVNAAQAKKLAEKAREKNLFLMEAVWTRWFPLSIYVREQITSGRIGTVYRVQADLSMADNPDKTYADGKNRMVNLELAGGAQLDLGIYALTWCFQTLYHTQPASERKPPKVQATMKHFSVTGSDESTTVLLTFPRSEKLGGDAHAVAMSSIRVATDPANGIASGPAIRIQGDKGEIQVFPPAFRPVDTRVILSDGTVEDKHWEQPGPGKGSGFYNGFGDTIQPEGVGQGMFWEADEAAVAIFEGRKEGSFLDLAESIVIMETMDEIRKQGGLKYPDKIETLDYPVAL
ncbi:dimeric dihydrodiol dehydrogenase [Mytilinidion resinicola]|uniref:D-xylose 1-dehydrogenase (NADP(+), D-xylono-1,5-lactone-forming) n=1 Tax=Mytilinidion resinicola TaxID=574789 RepID=A0A6A6YS43_9PEZI|nr:dimeric dihydrodiol dehydrogenase [Mytilinidion resinicola]KAF2810785.1 dimeric dihydrodiol dehydrogenase [Mytilinidion resinicola]